MPRLSYENFIKPSLDNSNPLPRELRLAETLIAKYGFERAAAIVDFCHQQAQANGFRPDTFGGIRQYEARAIADFDKMLERKISEKPSLPAHIAREAARSASKKGY